MGLPQTVLLEKVFRPLIPLSDLLFSFNEGHGPDSNTNLEQAVSA